MARSSAMVSGMPSKTCSPDHRTPSQSIKKVCAGRQRASWADRPFAGGPTSNLPRNSSMAAASPVRYFGPWDMAVLDSSARRQRGGRSCWLARAVGLLAPILRLVPSSGFWHSKRAFGVQNGTFDARPPAPGPGSVPDGQPRPAPCKEALSARRYIGGRQTNDAITSPAGPPTVGSHHRRTTGGPGASAPSHRRSERHRPRRPP